MSRKIPDSFIDDMLARTDIVDLIDSYVPLKKAGKNYSACCPFHQEKTPSFTVSPDKQFFYCFGCGANGNAIGFLMDYNNCAFQDALKSLAELNGTELPTTDEDTKAPNNTPIYNALEQANTYYQQQLRHHAQKGKAVTYLKNRGLSGIIAKDFELGYAPPGWDNFTSTLSQQPNSKIALKASTDAGLIIEKDQNHHYDRFRDRIMFPIKDKRGRTVAFGGRVLGDEKPKYLNSPETSVFHKSKELYGLYQALQKNRHLQKALIVEGYMDVIALAQQGIHYAMATLGTATSEAHLETLFRLCDQVVFCFDGDDAGRKAAWRAMENTLPTLRDGREAKFLFLPEGEDPDTLVRKVGKELFEHRINQAKSLSDYFYDTLSLEINTETMDGKAKLATKAKPFLDHLPKGVFKELMMEQLAKITGMDLDKLTEAINTDTSNKYKNTSSSSNSRESESTERYEDSVPPDWHSTYDYWPLQFDSTYASQPQESPPFNRNKLIGSSQSKWFRPRFKNKKPFRESVQTPSLIDRSIRLLLQNPNLAAIDIPSELYKVKLPHSELFFSLLELLRQNPNTSTAYLFGLWHETPEGRHLANLAAQEFLVKSHDKHELEFNDAIKRLHALSVEQAFEQESKSPNPDGTRLKELLNLIAQLK